MGKLSLGCVLFKGWLLTPPKDGLRRWLVHAVILSVAFSAILLLPVHCSQRIASFLLADYDYRVMSVDGTESSQVASQPFVQRKCSLYPTAITELSYCGRTAEVEVRYCSRDDDLALSWFE